MGKLSRPGLGEIHPVAGAQPAGLALEIGAELRVAAVFVNEAVPDIDVDDACLVGPAAIKIVEKGDVRRSFLPAQRGNPTQNTGTPEVFRAAIVSSMRRL